MNLSHMRSASSIAGLKERTRTNLNAGSSRKQVTFESVNDLPYTFYSYRSVVIMLMGRRGVGKTHAMTALTGAMARMYEREGLNRRIYSNYINLEADVSDPELVTKMSSPYGSTIGNGLAVVDEIQEAAKSRRPMSGQNINLSDTLTQIRKLNLDLCFTTQYAGMIDKWVLWQVDFFIEPRQAYGPKGWGDAIQFAVHDWHGAWPTTSARKKRFWPPLWDEADQKVTWGGTRSYFDSYFDQERVFSQYIDPDVRKVLQMRQYRKFGVNNSGLDEAWDIDPADLAGDDIRALPADPNDPLGRPEVGEGSPPAARAIKPSAINIAREYRWAKKEGYKGSAQQFEKAKVAEGYTIENGVGRLSA